MFEESLLGFLSFLFGEEEDREFEDDLDCDLRGPHKKGMEEWEKRSKATKEALSAISKARREP
jgi:hypothetical protein